MGKFNLDKMKNFNISGISGKYTPPNNAIAVTGVKLGMCGIMQLPE